jgi:predicted PurR-regulated permease PerM
MKDGAHQFLKFYTLLLLFLVLLFFVLYQARILLIPLSFAFLICFMYYPVGVWVEKRVGRVVSILFCLILLLIFGFLIFQLLSNSLSLLHEKFINSQGKILGLAEAVIQYFDDIFAITPEQRESMVQQFYENLLNETIPLLKQTISLSAGTLAMLVIIPIFVSLILLYRELLLKFAILMVPEKDTEGFKATVKEMTTTYFQFAKGMAIVYLIVGLLNSIGFLLIGLPNAVYFGVLASLLTFFPYVGIMIGGAAAVIVAWTTYDSIWYPLGVVGVLTIVQYLEANVIFPVAVGHQLRINSLATLMAILVGGLVWGGAGMILFVPFAAILKILSDRVEGLQPLSVLLGPDSRTGKGKG